MKEIHEALQRSFDSIDSREWDCVIDETLKGMLWNNIAHKLFCKTGNFIEDFIQKQRLNNR